MAGTLHGSIEHLVTNTAAAGTRDCFAAIVNFFDSRFTRIASQAGSGFTGSASLALPGYTGDANASGENAFGVWRWSRADGINLYLLVQWRSSSAFGTSPGNPGTLPQGGNIGISLAARVDGTSPWAGGTANAGADSKGATVWTPGASTLVVWPRVNGPSGSTATNKEGCGALVSTTPNGRLQMLLDDDVLFVTHDSGNDGSYNNVFWLAPYTARSGVSPTATTKLACLCSTTQPVDLVSTVGSLAGSASFEGGGCVLAADGCRSLVHTSLDGVLATTQQPNIIASSEYDIVPIWLRAADSTVPTRFGLYGQLAEADLAFVHNVAVHDTNTAKTRAVFGTSTLGSLKFLTRWDGTTTPGSGVTRTGIQF